MTLQQRTLIAQLAGSMRVVATAPVVREVRNGLRRLADQVDSITLDDGASQVVAIIADLFDLQGQVRMWGYNDLADCLAGIGRMSRELYNDLKE